LGVLGGVGGRGVRGWEGGDRDRPEIDLEHLQTAEYVSFVYSRSLLHVLGLF
jgi:hypothetical protein